MRWRFKVRQTIQQGGHSDEMWKTLCIVFDSEAMGLMERILHMAGMDYKAEEADRRAEDDG